MAIIAFVRLKERKEAMIAIQSFNKAVQIAHVSAPIRSLQATKQRRQGKQMQQGSQNRGVHPSQINVGFHKCDQYITIHPVSQILMAQLLILVLLEKVFNHLLI